MEEIIDVYLVRMTESRFLPNADSVIGANITSFAFLLTRVATIKN